MGKVYVLAKAAETPQMMVQGGGGGNSGGLMMGMPGNIAPKDAARSVMEERYGKQNIPVRQSPSPKYTPSQLVGIGDKTSGMASKFGKLGGIAGALAGGINSFYNASSSGQPGALGAAAMGGWTGQQLAQPYATRAGAQIGVRAGEKAVDRDMAASQENYNEAQRMNQGLDGFKGSQSMKPMSFEPNQLPPTAPTQHPSVARRTEYMANTPEATAERERRANRSNTGQVGVLGNAGGRGSPNIFSDNYANTQRHQQMMNKIPAPPAAPPGQPTGAAPPGTDTDNSITNNLQQNQSVAVTGANTKDASLGNYGKLPVAVLDADKVKDMQNETPDGASSATVAGA
jgi:hypothetical protein